MNVMSLRRNGKSVAELRPVLPVADPLQQHRELMGVKCVEDPTLRLDAEDWPEPQIYGSPDRQTEG